MTAHNVALVGAIFAGLCLVGLLAWVLSGGNRIDPTIDLDDDWGDE